MAELNGEYVISFQVGRMGYNALYAASFTAHLEAHCINGSEIKCKMRKLTALLETVLPFRPLRAVL